MKPLKLLLPCSLAICLSLAGCLIPSRRSNHEASSIVQFLYPDKNEPFIQPQIPTLRLPLRVGVAFVPQGVPQKHAYQPPPQFTESHKNELLRKVSASFKALPFVQSIEIIPTTYLRPGGGFSNLEQLHAMMGIDVIALVAYDQVQRTGDTAWSLSYWTIVGAYVVPGQKNDTFTLMEAVVYDIPSRSLLFRAPGTSTVNGHSAPIRTDDELAKDAIKGFSDAGTGMINALKTELDLFKVRAKEEPQNIRIEHKPGYAGGGAFGGWFVACLGLFAAGRSLVKRLK